VRLPEGLFRSPVADVDGAIGIDERKLAALMTWSAALTGAAKLLAHLQGGRIGSSPMTDPPTAAYPRGSFDARHSSQNTPAAPLAGLVSSTPRGFSPGPLAMLLADLGARVVKIGSRAATRRAVGSAWVGRRAHQRVLRLG
jgi:hypothetical protein